uniref:(northern house mosquito) hypothetical protein n=1 Tax=Culex pipiens TaxID=7175 RepID=A0A8D8BUQ4_CULPI
MLWSYDTCKTVTTYIHIGRIRRQALFHRHAKQRQIVLSLLEFTKRTGHLNLFSFCLFFFLLSLFFFRVDSLRSSATGHFRYCRRRCLRCFWAITAPFHLPTHNFTEPCTT